MTKQPTSKGGTSRIRFILLDAEIPEGDLSQITTAIQNALKPAHTIVQQRLPPVSTLSASSNGPQNSELEMEGDVVKSEAEPQPYETASRSTREPRPRKPTAMKVLDIDLASDLSFENFANKHLPKNDTERNLVALAWFKEHRLDVNVTANHIYTCYRSMKWPAGIEDFPSILRSLKSQQLVKSKGRAEYEINHIGIARVEKMGPAS